MTKLLPVLARQESSAYSAVLGDPIPVRGHNSKRESSHGKDEKEADHHELPCRGADQEAAIGAGQRRKETDDE
jgi:hypothetical protein